jgi:amidase
MWLGLERVFRDVDLLLTPTLCTTRIPADLDSARHRLVIEGREVSPVKEWFLTYPFNTLNRCPALSLPIGRAVNGVPIGLQMVAPPWHEQALIEAAILIEQLVEPWWRRDTLPLFGSVPAPRFEETIA